MTAVRLVAMLFFIASLILSGCATVQERQAFSHWKEEGSQWSGPEPEDVELPELGPESRVDDYVLYAMLRNSGLRAAFDRWKATLEKIAPARSLPDPRFTYANYIKEVETRVGAQEQKFGLAQTFPWFGKLDLGGKIVLQEARAERMRYHSYKLELVKQVKYIYYEYSYLAEAIDITRDNVILLDYMESVARTTYKGGVGLQSAVIKAQVELEKLKDRLRSLQNLMRPLQTKMNAALNRPVNLPLPTPRGLPDEKLDIQDEMLFSLLKTRNPDLKLFDMIMVKEDLAVKLSEKNYFPDVTLGVDYIDTASRTDMDPPDNGKDPVIAMLSVNVPIWQKKYNAIKAEALARRRAVEREQKEKENMLVAELEMALFKLRDADRKVDLYQNTLIPKSEQSMKVTEQAFSANKTTFLDLIDSQRIFLGFQLESKRALADRLQWLAEIEMLTGGGLEKDASGYKDPTDAM